MRDLFSWKLLPSETDFESLWENATFVFDTNVLLDLYRVSRSTAKDYLDTLEKISDRIWLPYQVANEFLTRREEIINSEAASFQKALLELEKWKSEQENLKALRNCLTSDKTGRIVCDELKSLFEVQEEYISSVRKVDQAFRDKITQLSDDHAALNSGQDIILERLLDLFDAKVGEPFEQNILLDLHKQADERFQKLIPPGYMDNTQNKGDRKYGDFILWKQILIFAKKESQPIIFVTAEKKEDWWIKRNGEIVSPHEKLRQEFQEYVSQSFWMYRPQRFLEMARKKFMVDIDQKSIEEMSTIADDEFYDEQEDEIVNQVDESLEDVLEGVRGLNSVQYEKLKKAAMVINSSTNPFAEYAKAIFEKQIGENANLNSFPESVKAFEQWKAAMNSLSQSIVKQIKVDIATDSLSNSLTDQAKAIQKQINDNTNRNPLDGQVKAFEEQMKVNEQTLAKQAKAFEKQIKNAEKIRKT